MAQKTKCSICGDYYWGYGNNALPINDGFCCDICNDYVIAERLKIVNRMAQEIVNEMEQAGNGN